jgi:hypothetical protein
MRQNVGRRSNVGTMQMSIPMRPLEITFIGESLRKSRRL